MQLSSHKYYITYYMGLYNISLRSSISSLILHTEIEFDALRGCCCCLLFLTFSVLVANPKKLLYTVANPARGLLNREKRTKEKSLAAYPPPPPPRTPHTARSEKINKITRRIAFICLCRQPPSGQSRVDRVTIAS